MFNPIEFVLQLVEVYSALAVFLGTFFLGDELVYLFGFLSGTGLLSLQTVIIFSILGNGGCDIFWFCVARFDHLKFLKRFIKKYETKEVLKSEKTLEKLSRRKMFFSLVLSKFFYGTRLLTIFYIAKKEKHFYRIMIYNLLAVIVWVSVVASAMWYIAQWSSISYESVQNVNAFLSTIILVILFVFLFNKFVVVKIISSFKKKKKRV